jgi:hypothetical protein
VIEFLEGFNTIAANFHKGSTIELFPVFFEPSNKLGFATFDGDFGEMEEAGCHLTELNVARESNDVQVEFTGIMLVEMDHTRPGRFANPMLMENIIPFFKVRNDHWFLWVHNYGRPNRRSIEFKLNAFP